MTRRHTTRSILGFVLALALLLVAYLPTLQRMPNGSEHYFMIDVGETQIVLNRWGTLHPTGYPLYVMIGSIATAVLRAFGVEAATAPGVVSLGWGVLTLGLIYLLALHITRRPLLASAATLLFGLTRTMWVHNDIAEVYTMTLFFLPLMLLLALWQPPIPGRLFWLALVGGIAASHHRALALAAPALIIAVWGDVKTMLRKRPVMLLVLLGLGLLGLLPYGYMVMRAQQGAAWVYGEPGTLQGLLDQFTAKEAARFIGMPDSFEGLLANINLVNSVLITDVTLPGLLAGIVGLLVGLSTHRRAALVILVSGLVTYVFHALFYTDVLSPLILATTLSLSFGWLFLADAILSLDLMRIPGRLQVAGALLVLVTAFFAATQYSANQPFITELVTNPTGLKTIALAQHTPPNATLMLAWGPRYFAAGFARDVLGLLPGVRLVDHKANYAALLQQGPLVTASYTFYNQPVSWWQEQIGAPVYLRALAPDLVQIDTSPELVPPSGDETGVSELSHRVECMPDKIILRVSWHTVEKPERDLSVFVHLLDANDNVIAQDDQSAPVYGWRPLTGWVENEVVRDVYTLPRDAAAAAVTYGLYEQRADGSFNNVIEYSLPVECG